MLKLTAIAAAVLFAATGAEAGHASSDHAAHKENVSHKDHADHHGGKSHDAMTKDEHAAHKAQDSLKAAVANGGDLIVADVLGVVCDFCATAMNKTFGKRAEVAATYVDLDTKTLSIVTKPGQSLDDKTIGKLVKKSGYKLAAVRRGEALPASDPTPLGATQPSAE